LKKYSKRNCCIIYRSKYSKSIISYKHNRWNRPIRSCWIYKKTYWSIFS